MVTSLRGGGWVHREHNRTKRLLPKTISQRVHTSSLIILPCCLASVAVSSTTTGHDQVPSFHQTSVVVHSSTLLHISQHQQHNHKHPLP